MCVAGIEVLHPPMSSASRSLPPPVLPGVRSLERCELIQWYDGSDAVEFHRGIKTRDQLVSCVRDLLIDRDRQSLSDGRAVGHVNLAVCPTN